MRQIDFYFDVLSPFSWLASTQIKKLEKEHSVEFNFIPIVFGAVLNHLGIKGPAEIPAKRNYTFTDVLRWSVLYGLEVKGPPTHPYNPLLALRVCTAVEDSPMRARLSCALMAASWEKGLAVEDENVVTKIIDDQGLDSEHLLAAARSPEIKDKLRAATDKAIQRGVIGVPTFMEGIHMFWGNDRIDMLSKHLKGELPSNEKQLKLILSRSASATR